MTTLELLKKAHFSHQLPSAVLEKIAKLAHVVEWNEQQLIFHEGDSQRDLFVLSTGHVALEMNLPGRGPSRILTVRSGELLAWSALLGNGQMTTSAITLDPTTAVAIPGDRLLQLCQTDPEVGFHVMWHLSQALSRRLIATRLQLLDLFAKPH